MQHEHREPAEGEAGRQRRWVRWTKGMKRDFLDQLAATCNVKAAARGIGVDPAGVYKLRRKDKAFAAEWSAALGLGYEMLETQLVGHALAGGGPVLTNGDPERTGPIDVVLATQLLAQHREGDGDVARRKKGPPLKIVTPEQTDASIMATTGIDGQFIASFASTSDQQFIPDQNFMFDDHFDRK